MAHLESPTIDVRPIAHETFRVDIEAECVVLKFDLSLIGLLDLATEALEAILTAESELDECSLCGPDGSLEEGDTCELESLASMLHKALRQHKHKIG